MSVIKQSQQLRQSQSGIVAVMVTLIMMIVISLIVLGFAQITRRAQRNAIDAQLSSQAFYAAESGLNDAMSVLRSSASAPAKTTCADTVNYQFNTLGYSNLGGGVSYSCVLIEPNPSNLTYKLGASGDAIIKLKTASGQPFTTVTLTWVPAPGQEGQSIATCPVAAARYPVASGPGQWNCKFATLRTELAPTDVLTRNNLINLTHVNFLEPVRAGGSSTMGSAANAQTTGVLCQNSPVNTCKLTITGLSARTYYMRVHALYQPTTLTVSATDAGGAVGLADAQAQISVTGKAQDVLRRILVAVALDDSNVNSPTAALISGDSICKRFSVTPTSFSTDDFAGGAGNPLCTNTNI